MSFSGQAVALNAGVHAFDLFGGRVGLVAGLPLGCRQTVDDLARGDFVERRARFDDPVRQTIPAEAGETHQIDVLRIMAVPQMVHQPAKRGCSLRIGQGFQGIVCIFGG